MENSGQSEMNKFIDAVKSKHRKRSIRNRLKKKRIKGQNLDKKSQWTNDQEQKYGVQFRDDLQYLSDMVAKNSKVELIQNSLKGLKTNLLEIHEKMFQDKIDMLLIDIFQQNGQNIVNTLQNIAQLNDEECLSLVSHLTGLICVTEENMVLSNFKTQDYIPILLASSKKYSRLKSKTTENLLYCLKNIMFDDIEMLTVFADEVFKDCLHLIDDNLQDEYLKEYVLDFFELFMGFDGKLSLHDYCTDQWILFANACVDEDGKLKNALSSVGLLLTIFEEMYEDEDSLTKLEHYIELLYKNDFYSKIPNLLKESDPLLVTNVLKLLTNSLHENFNLGQMMVSQNFDMKFDRNLGNIENT